MALRVNTYTKMLVYWIPTVYLVYWRCILAISIHLVHLQYTQYSNIFV